MKDAKLSKALDKYVCLYVPFYPYWQVLDGYRKT